MLPRSYLAYDVNYIKEIKSYISEIQPYMDLDLEYIDHRIRGSSYDLLYPIIYRNQILEAARYSDLVVKKLSENKYRLEGSKHKSDMVLEFLSINNLEFNKNRNIIQ